MITTHTDHDKRLHVVFDDERTAPVENYTICLVSMNRAITAQPWESAGATWQRVLDTIAGMRMALPLSGPQFYFATVFANVQPSEQRMQAVTKDRISSKLYELADPKRNKNSDARVKALAALAELHGLYQPVSITPCPRWNRSKPSFNWVFQRSQVLESAFVQPNIYIYIAEVIC